MRGAAGSGPKERRFETAGYSKIFTHLLSRGMQQDLVKEGYCVVDVERQREWFVQFHVTILAADKFLFVFFDWRQVSLNQKSNGNVISQVNFDRVRQMSGERFRTNRDGQG
jgi:hypothetical protein